ncbi:Ankyrin repeat protein [Rickettsiales bacterium Ac37b]|nr:Ankyrin repeat protein [Rickettsiales bacterium Ac37b]
MLTYQEEEFLSLIRTAEIETLEKMLQSSPGLINIKTNDGSTALHYAIAYGHNSVIKFLESKGLKIDIKEHILICLAAHNGHNHTIEFLEKKGLKLDEKTNNGFTLIHFAAMGGQNRTIEFLEKKGLSIDAKTNNGSTGLHLAAYNGHNNTIKFLIQKGLRTDEKTQDGRTLLHFAAMGGQNHTIEFLEKKALKRSDQVHEVSTNLAANYVQSVPKGVSNKLNQVNNNSITPTKDNTNTLSANFVKDFILLTPSTLVSKPINSINCLSKSTNKHNVSPSSNNRHANLTKQIQDLTKINEDLKKSNSNKELLIIQQGREIYQLKFQLEIAEQYIDKNMNNNSITPLLYSNNSQTWSEKVSNTSTNLAVPPLLRKRNYNSYNRLSSESPSIKDNITTLKQRNSFEYNGLLPSMETLFSMQSETINLTFQDRENKKRKGDLSYIIDNKSSRSF